jgi:hypothetical protein
MKLTMGKILTFVTVVALLVVPEIALTQGPGTMGRVLNVRLRTVYATVTAALADPNLMAGDRLLIAGMIDESANMGINFAGVPNITIVSESRPGFIARIDTGGLCLTTATNFVKTVIDLSGRVGTVTWIGGIINVPAGCWAFFSDTGPGTGITIQGVTIQGAAGNKIRGIGTRDEAGGPFRFLSNRITGEIDVGIGLDGPGGMNIDATIRGNRITITGATSVPDCIGIGLTDTQSATTILVERNRVDGGNVAGCFGGVGIGGFATTDVTVQRNTVQNFASGLARAGVLLDATSNVVVRSNVIRNNATGVLVDPGTCSVVPFPLVNNNNITGSTTAALIFGTGACSYDLDATNNWWGANTGPQDFEGDAACGSPTPPTSANCNTAAGAGGKINATAKGMGTADCCGGGSMVTCNSSGFVKTCPFKLFAIFGIGA